MQTNQLQRNHPNTKRTTVGRGGKRGKTSGRGGKGQSARAGNKRRPEWRDIIKRLPKLRGRGKSSLKPFAEKPTPVNLDVIEAIFKANDAITPTILVTAGVISTQSGYNPKVKILGDGEVTKAFKISGCLISESAKAKIEKAGGSVEAMPSTVVVKVPTPAQAKKAAAPRKAKATPEEIAAKAAKKAAPAAEKVVKVKAVKKEKVKTEKKAVAK